MLRPPFFYFIINSLKTMIEMKKFIFRALPADDGTGAAAACDKRGVMEVVVESCRKLLTQEVGADLYWTGTKTDLIELLHGVWEAGVVFDEHGRPVTLVVLTDAICRVLHVAMPASPAVFMQNVNRRKGIRVVSVWARYAFLIDECCIKNPMMLEVRVRRTKRQHG